MSISSTAGKKTHQCDFCEKLFSTASNLREHRRTHTGEKPFVCKYCGKAFGQSSTHSKHQLVHKNKEMMTGSQKRFADQISGGQREPHLTKFVETSTSEFRNESSLLPSETFNDTLKEHKLIMAKNEVESFDDIDWCNSNAVFDKPVDTSLHIESVHDDIERSPADQNPIITGMFKNRACELVSLPEPRSTSMKQEFFNVQEIDVGSSSFLTEVNTAKDTLTIQYEEAQNLEASALFIHETKTILREESNEFTSLSPGLPVYSKGIGRDDPRIWNNHSKETSIIQLDLTLDDDDDDDDDNDVTDVEEKFQNDVETFFKCIHCSETFSSLEEHVCLAKEAKMFFKCKVCEESFTQYGPFVQHKKTHEDPKEFIVGSSSASTTTEYKTCGNTITVNLQNESSNISRMTNSIYLDEESEGSCLIDLPSSSFQSMSEQIPSSTLRVKEEEQNKNDVIIIDEDPVQDVRENRVIEEKMIEKNSAIYNLSNTNRVDYVRAGYVERSNRFVAERNKHKWSGLSSDTSSKPRMETSDRFHQLKQQASAKKTLQQIGKKVHPYTCLFCPRRFSTASNMREHMRTHTGEKPFSCDVCHKKFAQSSTRSKHMLIHKGYKLPSYGKEILPRQTFRKPDAPGSNQEKPFLLDRFANLKENPRINPIKSLPLKVPGTKSYSSLTNNKVFRQPLKRHPFRMPSETSSNSLIPSKLASNKFLALNAKPSWRNVINKNNNNFGYQKGEYKNKTNTSHTKECDVLIRSNNPNINTKTALAPTVAYSTGLTTTTIDLSFESPKTKIDRLPSFITPTTTTASMLPRPMSRCANKLLRNARTYRPFRCTYCPRTFSTSGNMKEHMRTHTGEKPFKCEYCDRRFAQSSTHSKHVLIHIRKQQLNCFFCGKIFSQVALLRDHVISDHKTSHENHGRNIQAVSRLPRHSIEENNNNNNNKTRDSLSLSSKVQSKSFPKFDNGNRAFRKENLKRNETIAASESNSVKLSTLLTKKRFLEIDLSTNKGDHLIQEQYKKSCRSFQENEQRNDRKRDSTEIGKTFGKEPQENVDSVIAERSFISQSNSSNDLAEGTSITGQLESYRQPLSDSDVEFQFKIAADTDGRGEECSESKVFVYDGTKSYQSNVLFSSKDQSLTLPSLSLNDRVPTNETPINCLPLKTEIDEVNESKMDALYSSNNTLQDDKRLIFSSVTDREQSTSDIGNRTSFESAEYQNKVFVDLNSDVIDRRAIRQNGSALFNSELSLNSCNGDFSKNFNWLLDAAPETKSAREGTASVFIENNDNKILGSKMDTSVQDDSIVLLPNIKLETNVYHKFNPKQLQSTTTSSLTQGSTVDDSFSSGSHLKISEVAANVPYPVTDDVDDNKRTMDNSNQLCDYIERFNTNLTSAVVAASTKLVKSHSAELKSVCRNNEPESSPLNGVLPNAECRISKTPLERKRKNLPRHMVAGKFRCTYCNRSFSSRSNMKEHTRIHTGEKPFECVFCSRRFAQSSTHSKHVQTHLRFKQLVCPQCGKRFLQASNLCHHIRSQHKNTSGSSAAKRVAPYSDPSPPMAQKSSDELRKSSSDNEKPLVGFVKDSKKTISVPDMSIELSDDLPEMPSQLRSLKNENNSLININYEQTYETMNRDVPLTSKNYLNSPNINFETTTQLNQSSVILNKPQVGLSKRNNDDQFSSEHSILNSIQTLGPQINLRKPSSDTLDKRSSDYYIYNKETFSELTTAFKSEKKNICETSDVCISKSPPTPPLVSFAEIPGNDDSYETLSPALEAKCEICSEVFDSDKLLYAHQRRHFVNLAEQKGFDPKSFPTGEIGDPTSLRRFLRENNIKCYNDLEKSFEKIVAVFSLEKLLKEPFSSIASQFAIVEPITNEEMSESMRTKTENNCFNPRDIERKPSSTLPITGLSSSSTSSLPPSIASRLLSSDHLPRHSPSFPPICREKTKSTRLLYFHRCLFCSKMFKSNADILKHLRIFLEDEEDEMSAIRSKFNQKPKEYIAWYKHIAIVLGVKLQELNKAVVENTQHFKISFGAEERLQTLLHRRRVYKCRQCHKEYTTFHSLFFHKGNHSKRLNRRKSTQKIHSSERVRRRQSIISIIISMERISLNKENDCYAIGKHEKCPKISLPLLCFSRKDHFWLTHLKGKLKAIRSDFRSLSVDEKSLPIEIESINQHFLSDIVDSQLEKPQKSFSEKNPQTPDLSNERYDNEQLEYPLHLFLNSFKDNVTMDLTDDDLKQKEDVQPKLDSQFVGVNNLAVIKMFGQVVTAMVSFQLQKCVHCGKLFTNFSLLKRHLQSHAGKLTIRCRICPKGFTNFHALSWHKILSHFDENHKSLKNKRSDFIAGRKSLCHQKDIGSNMDDMKVELESAVNVADVDTVSVSDLVNKALDNRMPADFSDSTSNQKSSNEDSKTTSEMMDNHPRVSDRHVPRVRLKRSSEPFKLEQNHLNDCRLENLQSETTELAAEIKIVENEYLDEPTRVSPSISDEDCIYVSSSSEPVYKKDMSAKRNVDVFGRNWSRQENDENKSTDLKQPMLRANMQLGLNPKFNEETSVNSSFGNGFVLSDSNNEIQESNLKKDGLTDCIFINDDCSSGDAPVFDAGLTIRQYLPDQYQKTNIANEIIILSDEDEDDDDDDSAMNFNEGNSLITICDDTETFFGRPKEKKLESRPKVDEKLSQVFYEPLGTCLQNSKTNYANEPDMQIPNEAQGVQTILSTSSLSQLSSIATANSSTTVNLENVSYWSKSRPSFKEYHCLYCTKTCSSSSNLKEHMRRHTGERPFSCDVCHKTFAQKSTLSKHTQIHSRFKMLSSSENVTAHKSNSSYVIRPTKQIEIPSTFDHVDSLDKESKSKQTFNVDTNSKSSILTSVTDWDAHTINIDLSNTLNNQQRNDKESKSKQTFNVDTNSKSSILTSVTDWDAHTINIDLSNTLNNQQRNDKELKNKQTSNVDRNPKSLSLMSITDWESHTINTDLSNILNTQQRNDLKSIIDVENDRWDVTPSSEMIITSLSSPPYTQSAYKSITDWDIHTIDADIPSNLINQKCNDVKAIIEIENDHVDVTQTSLSSPSYTASTSDNDPFPTNSAYFPLPQTVSTKSNSIQPQPCVSNIVPKNDTFKKPYSCDICDRMFSTVGNLKEHRRTHTGERPFECPFCEKTFAQASTRSRHVKNHSPHFAK